MKHNDPLQILAMLVWCHENEGRHLQSHDEFERQKSEAWASAMKLLKEQPSSDPSPSLSSAAISREELARFLGEAIRTEIYEEGAILWQARLCENGDEEVPLQPAETAESAGAAIWQHGDTNDIVHASKNCGAIQGYLHVARHFDIALPPEIKALEEWGDTINPS